MTVHRIGFKGLSGRIAAWLSKRRADRIRNVSDGYLKGYRRLAPTADAVVGQHCWNCMRAVGHVSWWCDRAELGCEWERCYVADELTRADLTAGRTLIGGWVGLPPEPIEKHEEGA